MTFMNDFVEEEWCNMKGFINKISVTIQLFSLLQSFLYILVFRRIMFNLDRTKDTN